MKTIAQAADMAQTLATVAAEINREMSNGGEPATLDEIRGIAEMAAELADMLDEIENNG